MSWFKKKTAAQQQPTKIEEKKPAEPKKKTELVYRDESFDIGVTTVYITFSDGREVSTKFYGKVDQYDVDTPYVMNSKQFAQQFIMHIPTGQYVSVTDDLFNPIASWSGIIHNAEIHSTEEYNVTYPRAYRIEVKDDSL